VAKDRVFMFRQVVYISLCLKMLNSSPDKAPYHSVLFIQALKLSDCLIVSLVKEVLRNVGINNIT
jgi:hypothetical protein